MEPAGFSTNGARRDLAASDTVTIPFGVVCATETGRTDPNAEAALKSKLAVAIDSDWMRFAVFPAPRNSEA